jgi:hypothetical protein
MPDGGVQASRFLRATGQHAVIEPDTYTDGGFVLSIGGAEQSHVDLADPEDIFYEYLRRIGHIVDLAAPWGEPIRALHLGAGALTLARYIQATRPGSVQYAVELERELLDFVLERLPLPDGTDLHTVIGDARAALAELPRTCVSTSSSWTSSPGRRPRSTSPAPGSTKRPRRSSRSGAC